MSLTVALSTIEPSDFDLIYRHLRTHQPRYQNMHMRQPRTIGGKRVLRYLHTMRVKPKTTNVIEGMISGPDILWSYQITRTSVGTAVRVRTDKGSPDERARLARRFRKEIIDRVQSEIATKGKKLRTRRLKGQFYLRRCLPGMPSTHPHCRIAVERGVLHEPFLSEVLTWGFELLYP